MSVRKGGTVQTPLGQACLHALHEQRARGSERLLLGTALDRTC
jgi:hypothetical protein